jgi:hypothetical protein
VEQKAATEFYKGHGACKPCYAVLQQIQRVKHIDKRKSYDLQRRPRGIKRVRPNPRGDKNYNLLKKFGITIDQYDRLLEEQRGVCAICKREEVKAKQGVIMALAVDHCHKTGKVRGLLCNSCNLALGKFGDDAGRLRAAINYLGESN